LDIALGVVLAVPDELLAQATAFTPAFTSLTAA
jgi:hypothetical protein